MRNPKGWLIAIALLLLLPALSAAALTPSFDALNDPLGKNYIIQTPPQIIIEQFTASVSPTLYKATLSDLSTSLGLPPLVFSAMSINRGGTVLGSTIGPGSFLFNVELGKSYFLNILGVAGASLTNLGYVNVTIEAVPLPPALLLLGSGILGLVLLRRRAQS